MTEDKDKNSWNEMTEDEFETGEELIEEVPTSEKETEKGNEKRVKSMPMIPLRGLSIFPIHGTSF